MNQEKNKDLLAKQKALQNEEDKNIHKDTATHTIDTETHAINTVKLAPKAQENSSKNNQKKKYVIIFGLLSLLVGFSLFLFFMHKNATSTPSVTSKTVGTATNQTADPLIPTVANPTDPTKIPLGDNRTQSTPQVGYIDSCETSFIAGAGGASSAGPWIDAKNNTWDSKKKIAVSGSVSWPNTSYSASISGTTRTITSKDLPINGQTTGIFPIQTSDQAYKYDRNPNAISSQTINLMLPANPSAASKPNCLNMGPIGILNDGVVLFNGLDGEGRDAAAHETLDSCDGHPEKTDEYHHHNIPVCILSKHVSVSTATLVGYANDGYGIYIERDKNGNLPTNAQLDECHGRTSTVNWDGKDISMYHYVATIEFPYTIGCFHGTSSVKQSSSTMTPQQAPQANPSMGPPPIR
jgi:hypothetical protein